MITEASQLGRQPFQESPAVELECTLILFSDKEELHIVLDLREAIPIVIPLDSSIFGEENVQASLFPGFFLSFFFTSLSPLFFVEITT